MAYKLKKCGDYRTRRSFSKSKNTMELSDLLEVQKKSYQRFLEEGIREVFDELFPVESFTGNVTIDFGDYSFDEPRYSIKEAKERMVNYAAPLKVKVMQNDAAKIIHDFIKATCINMAIEFYYYSQDDRYEFIDDTQPRFMTEENSVEIDSDVEYEETDEEPYLGNVFEDFEKKINGGK